MLEHGGHKRKFPERDGAPRADHDKRANQRQAKLAPDRPPQAGYIIITAALGMAVLFVLMVTGVLAPGAYIGASLAFAALAFVYFLTAVTTAQPRGRMPAAETCPWQSEGRACPDHAGQRASTCPLQICTGRFSAAGHPAAWLGGRDRRQEITQRPAPRKARLAPI